jgi:hypothetical protein
VCGFVWSGRSRTQVARWAGGTRLLAGAIWFLANPFSPPSIH